MSTSLRLYGLYPHQAPLSVGFSRHEYWSGLPYPPPFDLLNPGIEPASLMSPALAGRFFTTRTTWEDPCIGRQSLNHLTPTEVPDLPKQTLNSKTRQFSLACECVLGEGPQVSFPPLPPHYPMYSVSSLRRQLLFLGQGHRSAQPYLASSD